MTYYNEGFDAAQCGISYWACPYKNGTAGYAYWRSGWNAALWQSVSYGDAQ